VVTRAWAVGGLGGVQAGDVIYTDVDRQGGGIVEFANKADQVGHPASPFDQCLTSAWRPGPEQSS
jgi:hypothetical protein